MTTTEKPQETGLNNRQMKYLRGLGHKLSPLVLVGKEDISENLLEAVRTELANHELIKVKIGSNSGVDKKEAARFIPEATDSFLVQFIGKTLLLFKANPKKPKDKRIQLP
jgi:RNA-binding protein